MRQHHKRIRARLLFWILLAGILFGITVMDVPALAISQTDQRENSVRLTQKKLLTGKQPFRLMEVDAADTSNAIPKNGTYLGSAIVQNEWDQYSSNYFYNRLETREKAVWDAMDRACLELLTGMRDVQPDMYQGGIVYHTQWVQCSSEISQNTLYNIAMLFHYSNPQYYFLNTGCLIYDEASQGKFSGNSGNRYISFPLYQAFSNGTQRASATESIKQQVTQWLTEAEALCTDDADKVRYFHDAIVNKVDYDTAFFGAADTVQAEMEESHFTQSAYSVFCRDVTVCAGYSQAFEILLNGAGIDCISVTSYDHQWNKVRLNDSWSNVDLTWADCGSENPIDYYYFERSDSVYDSDFTDRRYLSHREETAMDTNWRGFLPPCTVDSVSDDTVSFVQTSIRETAGVLPLPSGTAQTPSIQITPCADGYAVTLSTSTSGAEIYYTVDGTEPSCANTRSTIYRSTFTDSGLKTIKAIAVRDTMYDSSVAAYDITEEDEAAYTIQSRPTQSSLPITADSSISDNPDSIESTGPLNIASASVTLSTTDYTYDGKEKKPSVTIVYQGNRLKNGTDYTISYHNNINAGTATITITGQGAYTGTTQADFSIRPAAVRFKNTVKEIKYRRVQKKAQSYSIIQRSDGGNVTCKVKKGKKKYITISKSGMLKIKKGIPAGVYKLSVTVAPKGNYRKTKKTIVILVSREN